MIRPALVGTGYAARRRRPLPPPRLAGPARPSGRSGPGLLSLRGASDQRDGLVPAPTTD